MCFAGNLKPKVCSLVKYMRNEGIERIALIGFSWYALLLPSPRTC